LLGERNGKKIGIMLLIAAKGAEDQKKILRYQKLIKLGNSSTL
tara:strand:+ start:486 stop:614 length:129 start_codon:yes stop_codon:yes gene_type:complete